MLYGRAREIAQLDTVLAECGNGRGRLVLFAGEPGIGKTRLATTFAARAEAAGMRTLWGRCREEGGTPAYWPWVQILRALAADLEPQHLAAAMGRDAAIIVAAVPEIAARIPVGERPRREPGANRFAFFDAVQLFLAHLAAETPLLLILDDLHAADASSLALLEFIAPDLERSRLIALCTYREHEASALEAGRVIARIARHGPRLRLTGLAVEEVERLAAEIAGRDVPRTVGAALHSATEGNPLFVMEMVRSLASKGTLAPGAEAVHLHLSDTVQHVIGVRLGPLPAPAREALSAAAVIGRSFDVATLEMVTGNSARELLTLLQAGVEAGIATAPIGVRGESMFTHALYRESLYGALTVSRRAELHADVAAGLERRSADADLSAIAFHLLAAGPLGDSAKAVEFATRAADQAMARLAFEQAVVHYGDALGALDARPHDQARRTELLLRLGEAHFRAGAGEASKKAYHEAAASARASGDTDRLASAALGVAGGWNFGGFRAGVIELLEEALHRLTPEHAPARAKIMARLSIAYAYLNRVKQAQLSKEALTLARQAGDAGVLAEALLARHYALEPWRRASPHERRQRVELAREAADLALRLGDAEMGLRAGFCLIQECLWVGDRHGLDREIAAATRLAESLRQPFYDWFVVVWRSLRAMIDGRLDDAERLIGEALALGRRTQGDGEVQQFAHQLYFSQLYCLRRDQGRGLSALEVDLQVLVEQVPVTVIQGALTRVRLDLGRASDARDDLERLTDHDFAAVPEDSTQLTTISILADICAGLGDEVRARLLYDRARAADGEHLSNGALYLGAMAHYLGRLAATLGRVRDADAHFAAAERQHRRLGARCWIARTQYHWAEMLLRQPGAEDRARGRALLQAALERARHLGMQGLVEKAERLHGPADAAARPSDDAAYALCLVGDYWTVAFEGDRFQVKDQKGLRYLHHLLSHPGREVHVLDLVALADGQAAATVRRSEAQQHGVELDGGAAPELLDERALQAYRRRLRELNAEIAEAEAHNDAGQVARLRQESEMIGNELNRASGRGGRSRKLPDALERARLNVTRALRTAQRQLGQHSSELGRHLARTLRTGQSCCYDPGPETSIVWETSAKPRRGSSLSLAALIATLSHPSDGSMLLCAAEVMEHLV